MLKVHGQSGPTANSNSGDLTNDLAKVLDSHGYTGDRLQQAVFQLDGQAGSSPAEGLSVTSGDNGALEASVSVGEAEINLSENARVIL